MLPPLHIRSSRGDLEGVVVAQEYLPLLERLSGKGDESERAAIAELRRSSGADFCRILLEWYGRASKYGVKSACVYYAMFHAHEDAHAVDLGRKAVRDKSKAVRYRGAMLLALAQRRDTLGDLREAISDLRDGAGVDDLRAAVDAIENENQHYFLDRDHSGMVFLKLRTAP